MQNVNHILNNRLTKKFIEFSLQVRLVNYTSIKYFSPEVRCLRVNFVRIELKIIIFVKFKHSLSSYIFRHIFLSGKETGLIILKPYLV